ncbi:unnamed protein product [Cylicocyclus nassatus]|uniref:Uncharacterized protein n=1 Tax=Cylicocyclus nassatus TaxID=53992 RepID=A0AA36GNH3_CYLNA|nr:unnamed protein product [Cylicocyclus nassatus]
MNGVLLSLLLLLFLTRQSECGCYKNWSRCTPQTKFATGKLWKTCAEYCQKCKGRSSGKCVPVKNKVCSGGYQCQCTGGARSKSKNFLDVITCKLGL